MKTRTNKGLKHRHDTNIEMNRSFNQSNKHYQNVSYKELQSYADNNPNRNRKLESIEVRSAKLSQDTSLNTIGLKGYNAFTLNPTGILSLLVCMEDPNLYSLSSKSARIQQIIELATKLQEKTETLKNSDISRKRRKIYDLIGAAYNNTPFQEKEYLDLFHGISYISNIHFVLMKETTQENVEEGFDAAVTNADEQTHLKGEIVFSSDPSKWKRDNPIYVANYRGRWVAVPSDISSKDIHLIMGEWLSTIEQSGWIVQWPSVDAPKTELVEKLSALPTWNVNDKKHTKEVLARRLGRANCIKLFAGWSLA